MKKSRRIDWVVLIACLLIAASCSGGGCGGCAGMEPIPGGFPADKRQPNAAQVRVSSTALTKIAEDPAAVIGPLIGGAMNGKVEFAIPASCGGNPEVCCVNGMPAASCGPLEIDLVQQPNDPARLVLTPVAGANRLDLTIRTRLKTKMDLPIRYDTGFLGTISCDVEIDTTAGNTPDLRIDAQIAFAQDPTAGTTRITAQNVSVSQLEGADVNLSGGIGCSIGSAFIGAFLGTLTDQVEGMIQDTINDGVCKTCDSGQVAECGSSFATACTDSTCMIGDRCLQSLGLDGRLRGLSLFGGFSPGTTGALDLYEVAGGYATTEQGGIALGLLGGMQPGGAERDRCGPSAGEPAAVSIPVSSFFQGNRRPDTNAAFDVAIGLHKSQLAEFAWAGYEGGLLCLTVGASTVQQLSTDTLSLLSRSLGNLVDVNSPMAVGLRPQSPPEILLGKNTFMDDGQGNQTLVEPLLDIRFQAMEIDFFVSVDDQWIRAFTVVSDVQLPLGLQTSSASELVPVFGDLRSAFTNLMVKNTEAITESPAELEALFPTVLELVLPQLAGGLGGFDLPALGGLRLQVTDITAVDGDQFLAIFANLVTAMQAPAPVATRVTLAGVAEPDAAIARDALQWKAHRPPSVTLDFGDARGLEYSYRIDGGAWSPWSANARPTLAPRVFWLPGTHKIEARARQIGRPETMDPTPEVIEVVLGTDVPLGNGRLAKNGFHGQAGEAGCGCTSATPASGGPLALAFLLVVLPLRRVRRRARSLMQRARRIGLVAWLAAIAMLPGCSCSSDPCGDAECEPGEVTSGGLGRYTSIAGDADRVLAATYDQGLGDLVVADVTDPANPVYVVAAGVPDDVPTYDPSTYRGGITEPGPDVGTWTSIAISGGLAKVAYQDRDNAALAYAHETARGKWASYTIDDEDDADIGSHASLAIDADGRPAIAYLAVGVDDGAGHRVTELRLARATVASPSAASQWSTSVIASGTGTCAGLCGSGTVCVAGAPESCQAPTGDCASDCGDGAACIGGSCHDVVPEPTMASLATGTGLFVNLLVLPDGRLAAVYYDHNARALVLSQEGTAGGNDFTHTTLDATTPGDRGMWASAVVDAGGTIHVAYQDALGDQLLYVSYAGGTITGPEVVDDGQRAGDRPHNVGAASAIYLAGGSPAIAYQDGTTADVYLASRGGSGWTTAPLADGPLLDGFSISVTTAHGDTPYLAWGAIDPSLFPLHSLVVQKP